MQRTTERLIITVGEDKRRIVLTDSAVEAVQGEAAGQARVGIDSVIDMAASTDLSGSDLGYLLELRDHLATAIDAVEVLIECRPLDELHVEDGSS